MARFVYYEVVRVVAADDTVPADVVGQYGHVLGLPDPGDRSDEQWYTVLVNGEAVCVRERDLAETGEVSRREDIYPGSSVRVSRDGRPLPPAGE